MMSVEDAVKELEKPDLHVAHHAILKFLMKSAKEGDVQRMNLIGKFIGLEEPVKQEIMNKISLRDLVLGSLDRKPDE
jgi:hypothetical protein